jgi:hypothetical protein
MGCICQTELYRLDLELESMLARLANAAPSERHEVLLAFERSVTRFVERIDALNDADSQVSITISPPLNTIR